MKIVVEREIVTQSSPGALWPALADTDRTNRAIGLGPVRVRPLAGGEAARFVVSAVMGGFEVEFEELPTEWQEGRFFQISRRMLAGPARHLETRFDLEPSGAGAKVKVTLGLEPSVTLLTPVLKVRLRQSLEQMIGEVRRVDDALASGKGVPPVGQAQLDASALASAARGARTRGDGALVDRIERLLREGDDAEVARLRPLELAREWGVDGPALLATMLEAVKAGLLELRWELICPSCRVGVEGAPALAQLSEHGRCHLCDIDFGLSTEDAVEVTFAPARGVRRVSEGPFCIAGPARTPHVLRQLLLPAQGEAAVAAPTEPGRYRLFFRGGAAVQLVVEPGAAEQADVSAAEPPARLAVAPGASLRLRGAGAPTHAKIERSSWSRLAVTARELGAMPAFRREFSSDLLRPGASLRVARVALFFSDLTGSTQLYSRVGDAAAFRLVHDHFDLVLGLIERHGGAVVKTIGDAVMAVFLDDMAAVAASMAVLRGFERFRGEHEHRAMTHIKLGVHAGPCYMVTANKILDYFGQTVNIAARLQGLAESGELVVVESMADEALARGLVAEGELRSRHDASLKGVDSMVRVARLVAHLRAVGAGRPRC